MCRHFDTLRGCGMGDKCQFAHGAHEMRGSDEVKYLNDLFIFLADSTNKKLKFHATDDVHA